MTTTKKTTTKKIVKKTIKKVEDVENMQNTNPATENKKNNQTYYAFKIEHCLAPHWQEGKITKEDGNFVLLEGCVFRISKKDLYTNRTEALIDFVKEMDNFRAKKIDAPRGKKDCIMYSEGKIELTKKLDNKINK